MKKIIFVLVLFCLFGCEKGIIKRNYKCTIVATIKQKDFETGVWTTASSTGYVNIHVSKKEKEQYEKDFTSEVKSDYYINTQTCICQ